LLIPFYYAVRKHVCHVPWLSIAWRPALASACMGLVLWQLRGVHALLLVIIAGGVYGCVLALLGGFNQPDMHLLWRLMPLGRLRKKLGRIE
jgi:hypothetical protein